MLSSLRLKPTKKKKLLDPDPIASTSFPCMIYKSLVFPIERWPFYRDTLNISLLFGFDVSAKHNLCVISLAKKKKKVSRLAIRSKEQHVELSTPTFPDVWHPTKYSKSAIFSCRRCSNTDWTKDSCEPGARRYASWVVDQ